MADITKINLKGTLLTIKDQYAYHNGDLATVATSGSYDDLSNKPTIPSASTITPLMDGTAAIGSSSKYAKEDHVHPSDTSRVPTSRKINNNPLSSDITLTASDVGAIPTAISTTYANLVTTRTSSQLTAGAWYRITDYNCTTTQTDTQSAGHQFDILVQATSPNTLSEEAKAIRHEGDTYFADANLDAWKIWYCIDNDTQRFAWADTTNGKGVIYRMIDEWNNDCPYDFKNIQYKRDLTDGELDTENGTTTWVYTFNLRNTAQELYLDASIVGNLMPNEEGFVNGVYNNKMGVVNSYTTYYGSGYDKTNFVLPDNVFLTKVEDEGYYGCYSNTFGNSCYSNTFGNSCSNNTFGNSCRSNTFRNDCYSNTLRNSCTNNIFGDNCYSNTFRNDCSNNTFGNGCYSNTFGNLCRSNTFGDSCSNITFGNNCRSNTFGNNCRSNTFGDSCTNNTFSKPYTQYVIVENGNKKITLTSSQTPTSSKPLHNITIAQGVNNTNTAKTISHNTLNDTFRTTYVATNSVEVQV